MNINFKKLSPNAVTPTYANNDNTNAGLDLTAISYTNTENYIEYDTGIAVEIPVGYFGLLVPNSRVSKFDLILANCAGIIDSNYRGSIKLRYKITKPEVQPRPILQLKKFLGLVTDIEEINVLDIPTVFQVGDVVGQLLILPIPTIDMIEVSELSDTVRGDGGFGSTQKEPTPEKIKRGKRKKNAQTN